MKRIKPEGNTSTGALKLLALVFMFCDHAGKMLMGDMMNMRILGRLALPLYAWCIVVGACYTHSMGLYMLRMLLVWAISQPLYMVALNHGWNEPNIMLTLMLGLGGIWGMQKKKAFSQVWAPMVVLLLSVVLHADYGWKGVLLIMLLYAVRDSKRGIAALMIVFCLFWGSNSAVVHEVFGFQLDWMRSGALDTLASPWLHLQCFAILALPLMIVRFPKDVRMPKWAGYMIYPLHLVALIIMEGQMLPGGWDAVLNRMNGLIVEPIVNFSINWTPMMNLLIDQIAAPFVKLFGL